MFHRHLLPLLLTALPALACTFNPRVPDGVVTCAGDRDCPVGLLCNRGTSGALGRCCRDGVCPAGAPGMPGISSDAGAGNVTPATGDAGAPAADAEITLPPAVPGTGTPPVDAGAPDTGGGDAPTAPAVTCTPSAGTPPPPAADRQTYCTFQLGDRYLVLGIDVVTANDPLTTRAHAACWTEPRPLAATTDPTGARCPPRRWTIWSAACASCAPAATPPAGAWWGRWPAPGRARRPIAPPSRRACGRTPTWSW
jgi:hypothetical protein